MTKLKDINWNQVYYFYEVARKMSMKEAAEVTGVSIPTVSEQIKRLETLLEVQLFHRRPRRIELTSEGETLYQYARQMFESGLRFLDAVSPIVVGGYPVRVGVQESFSEGPAMEFVTRYFDIYSPFGTVNTYREANNDRLTERVYNGELDWGISLNQPASPRLEFGKLASAEIVFCVASEQLAKYPTHRELFTALPLALGRYDEQLNKLVSDHLHSAEIVVEETMQSEHLDLCLHLAREGKCITLMAKGLSSAPGFNEPGLPTLQTFSVSGPMVLSYYAFWRQSNGRMISIRKLIELLEKENRGARPKAGGLTGPGAGSSSSSGVSGENILIELPH